MADAKKPSPKNDNRRSGLDRRWIIAPHEGPERRSGKDRRTPLENGEVIVADPGDTNEIATIQDLLMANSMQLDAIAQLLIEKGVFSKEDLFDMLKRIQKEYQKTRNIED
jgi:sugar lactone lactonase YvrE